MLAVRNPEKGNTALSRIIAASPRADVTLQALDLSSLDSVHSAADALRATYPRIDLLINSAGVMWTPKQVTKDGFQPLKAVLGPVLFQSAAMGALPTLRAATDPAAQYYGPDGFLEQRGHPKVVGSSAQSHDDDLQRRLWAVSEELTGVTFPV